MKKILKICTNTWASPSRDKRELTVCRNLGMEALVMAKGAPGDSFRQDEVDGFPVYRFSTRPLGTARWLNVPNRVLSLLIWGRKARKFQADIITGRNLPGLFIGYLSNLGNPHKAKLVYDSHEFELGREKNRKPLKAWFVKLLEGFLIKRCDLTVIVNGAMADELQKIYHLKERPVVARNVPPYWELDADRTARVRADFLERLGLPEDAFLVMYHGWLMPGRGIENLLRAVAQTPGIGAVVLGNPQEASYLESLHALCGELGVADRVLFHPAVPVEELRNYVGAAGAATSIGVGTYMNQQFSLPNKFFESIQSLTPLIITDFPVMGSILREYGIGALVDPKAPDAPAALAEAIRHMRDDRAFYAACKENLKRAKEELCWEREQAALREAYRRIME